MIIAIASLKGGVGKTISAIHLASYFQMRGPTVLLDSDDKGSAIAWARKDARDLPFKIFARSKASMIGTWCKHVVIDGRCESGMQDLERIAKVADLIVIPCTPGGPALATLRKCDKLLEQFGSANHHILLTNVPPNPQKDGEQARFMLRIFGYRVFHTEIRTSKAFERAAQRGCTVREISGDSRNYRAWAQYEALGREIEDLVRPSAFSFTDRLHVLIEYFGHDVDCELRGQTCA